MSRLRCREMSERLSELRDSRRFKTLGELVHLLLCSWCRRLERQLAALGAAAARPPETGPGLSGEAKDRLRRRLKDGS